MALSCESPRLARTSTFPCGVPTFLDTAAAAPRPSSRLPRRTHNKCRNVMRNDTAWPAGSTGPDRSMVEMDGLEPTTSCLPDRCSTKLSYTPIRTLTYAGTDTAVPE